MNGPLDSVVLSSYAAVPLRNGKLFLAGGDSQSAYISSAEIFDPSSHNVSTPTLWGAFSRVSNSLTVARAYASGVLLPSGKVLIVGGSTPKTGALSTSSSEVFDPSTSLFSATASMNTARGLALVAPANGGALVFGGNTGVGNSPNFELFIPGEPGGTL